MRWVVGSVVLAIGSTVAFLPDAQSRWMWPKLLVLAGAVTLGALVRPRGRLPRWLVVMLAAGGVLLAVGTLASAAPWAQAWGRWPRYEGLIALPVYFASVWLGARVLGPKDRVSGLTALRRASAVVAILLGGLAALESAGLRPIPSDISRPGSFTGTATDQGILGAILVAVLFVATLRLARAHARDGWAIAHYAGLVLAIAAVVLSASRAGLAALAVALAVVVAAEFVGRRRGTRQTPTSETRSVIAAGLFTGALVCASALLIPLTRARLFGGAGVEAAGMSDRPLIWRESLSLVAGRPWLGWGPSGFEDAIPTVHGTEWYATMGKGVVLDSPHNVFLQLAVAGGIPLLLFALATLAGAGILLARRWSAAAAESDALARVDADLLAVTAGAIAALGVGLATSFTSVTIVAIPALLFGAAVAAPVGARSRPAERKRAQGVEAWGTESRHARRSRRGLAAALAAWTVFLGVATSAEVPLAQAERAAAGGDLASTVALLEQAESRRPWDVDVNIIGAEILAAAADRGVRGAAEAAIPRAEAALDRTPASVQAAMALAIAQTSLGAAGDSTALEAAHTTLADLAARLPNDPAIAHRFAGVLIYEGRLADAEEQLVRASSLDPDNRDILLTLEYVYRLEGDEAALVDVRARLEDLSVE